MSSESPKKPFAVRRRVPLAIAAAITVLLAVFFLPSALRREDPSLAFLALPEHAFATSRHFDLAKTWKSQITTPVVSEIFRFFRENTRKIAEEEGTDWIIRITTGHSTTAAIAAPPDGDEDFILYAASFAGAREPLLRLMLFFHWIPGVGRLRESENGTPYLALKDLDEDNEDLRVGFALRNHTLLASLAKSPEPVRELERRIGGASLSPALFNGDAEPWKSSEGSPHTFWLHTIPGENVPSFVPAATATLRLRLSEDTCAVAADFLPGAFPFLPNDLMEAPPLNGRTEKGSSLAAGSAFALVLLPSPYAAPLLSQTLHLPLSKRQDKDNDAVLYLNGQPYGGQAVHVAVPAATLHCPGIAVSREGVDLAIPVFNRETGVRFRRKQVRGDGVLLDWLGEKGFVKLASKECFLIECPEKGASPELLLCSAAQSLDAQRRGTPPDQPAWREIYQGLSTPDASQRAFLYLDLDSVAYEARQILALARLVGNLGVLRFDNDEKAMFLQISQFLEGFHYEGSLGFLLSNHGGSPRLALAVKLAASEQP